MDLNTFSFTTFTVDRWGNTSNCQNLQARYFVEDLGNGVTLEMVQIPGGTFTMGTPSNEAGKRDDKTPQHQVIVPSFFMGKYVITQVQYLSVMGENPSSFIGAKRPVEKVCWDDAAKFCNRLSLKTKRLYRLPSEAEWEYACRAGTSTPFHFGETITTDLVNYCGENYPYGSAPKGEYRQKTTDVGIFSPNAFGLYDMHGNVYEWCQDTWHSNYEGAPTDGSAWIDDNNHNRAIRVLRGGSWSLLAAYCRSAERITFKRNFSNCSTGFRVVCVLG